MADLRRPAHPPGWNDPPTIDYDNKGAVPPRALFNKRVAHPGTSAVNPVANGSLVANPAVQHPSPPVQPLLQHPAASPVALSSPPSASVIAPPAHAPVLAPNVFVPTAHGVDTSLRPNASAPCLSAMDVPAPFVPSLPSVPPPSPAAHAPSEGSLVETTGAGDSNPQLSHSHIIPTLHQQLQACSHLPESVRTNILQRISALETMLEESRGSDRCIGTILKLTESLNCSNFDQAYAFHSELAVKHINEVKDWLPGVRSLILARKNAPS